MRVVGLKPTFKKYLFRDAQYKETMLQEFNPTFLSVGCLLPSARLPSDLKIDAEKLQTRGRGEIIFIHGDETCFIGLPSELVNAQVQNMLVRR